MAITFAAMSSKVIGSGERDVREPYQATLTFKTDVGGATLIFDVIDMTLPDVMATLYPTVALAQTRYVTKGVSRVIDLGSVSANIECPIKTYAKLMVRTGYTGLCTIDASVSQGAIVDFRAAIEKVTGATMVNNDRMKAFVTIAVTNSDANGMWEMEPVFR